MWGVSVRFLLWLLLFAIVGSVLLLLSIDVGLADWVLGTGGSVRGWLRSWSTFLNDQYGINKDSIEFALKIIGLVTTLLVGMIGAVKFLYDSETALPERIVRFCENAKRIQLTDRGLLLAGYATRNLKGDLLRQRVPALGERIWTYVRGDRRSLLAQRAMIGSSDLDNSIPALAATLTRAETQRINGHLAEGLQLVEAARNSEVGSAQYMKDNEDALAQFEAALKLDENDVDALELAAKQARLLNSKTAALRYLITLEKVSAATRPVRYARALRYEAEHLQESTRRADIKEVRTKLELALGHLENATLLNDQIDSGEKPLELALINEQLGAYHLKTRKLTLVSRYLDEAGRLYDGLPHAEASAGSERIAALRKALERAREGADDQDDA
jgi:hypothetical protein